MKFTTATLLIATSLFTTTVLSQTLKLINGTTYAKTVWAAQGDGPFDLGLVYPLYSSPNAAAAATHCSTSVIKNYGGKYTFSGWGLPINMIYFGTGFNDNQRTLIQNFLGNVGGTTYWNVVKTYANNGWTAATPVLGSSSNSIWHTDCILNSLFGLNGGCSLTQYNEQGLLNLGIALGKLVNQKWSITAIMLGTNVKYTSYDGQFVMGQSAFCGTHGISGWGASKNYVYITVQLPTSWSSTCNVGKALGGTFPNDYAVDNLISILAHELVESIVSPAMDAGQVANNGVGSAFQDDCSYQAADKCNNMYLSVGKFANNANLEVNGRNYLVFPVYDFNAKVCSMAPGSSTGGGSTAPSCGGGNRGNGICSGGLCCSQWGYCGTGAGYCW